MKKKWRFRLLFLLGFLLCSLPMGANLITRKQQAEAVATYQSAVEQEDGHLDEIVQAAERYNSMLWQSGYALLDSLDTGILSEESYAAQLDVSGTGIMGSLDIPKINVELPIRHGTDDEVLSEGIGHLRGTSLPVGGENTHSVLTGHRGLPGAKLLTRLDEMAEGDYFFLRICNETLAYRVTRICVAEPEDVSSLDIRAGEDLVSVVTCTPYGLNTHRLIVTGKRVPYSEADHRSIRAAVPSGREMLFTLLPLLLPFLGAVLYMKDRAGKADGKRKQAGKRRAGMRKAERSGRKSQKKETEAIRKIRTRKRWDQ